MRNRGRRAYSGPLLKKTNWVTHDSGVAVFWGFFDGLQKRRRVVQKIKIWDENIVNVGNRRGKTSWGEKTLTPTIGADKRTDEELEIYLVLGKDILALNTAKNDGFGGCVCSSGKHWRKSWRGCILWEMKFGGQFRPTFCSIQATRSETGQHFSQRINNIKYRLESENFSKDHHASKRWRQDLCWKERH